MEKFYWVHDESECGGISERLSADEERDGDANLVYFDCGAKHYVRCWLRGYDLSPPPQPWVIELFRKEIESESV